MLAGTVYLREEDATGVGGATVTVTDAAGRVLRLVTNSAGNLYLTPRSGSDLQFPLRVAVSFGGTERVMRSAIEREGSCAVCHAEPPGATTVGKVFVEDGP